MPNTSAAIDELWQGIFKKSSSETSETDLHLFTHYLVQRLFVLAKYPPASFGSFLAKVLTHPALNVLDKNVTNLLFIDLPVNQLTNC